MSAASAGVELNGSTPDLEPVPYAAPVDKRGPMETFGPGPATPSAADAAADGRRARAPRRCGRPLRLGAGRITARVTAGGCSRDVGDADELVLELVPAPGRRSAT